MNFRYLKDPLFLACFVAYWVNRFVIKSLVPDGFVHNYFNDLICIPFLVPIMLWIMRRCGLRPHDGPPQAHEIVLPLVVWSVMYEIVFASHPYWSQWVTGDPFDILWYSVGACGASLWWQHSHTAKVTT